MKTAQQIYDAAIKGAPRSPEWKRGTMAGLKRRESPHVSQCSPFQPGTAQDDAWAAGMQYGIQLWQWNQGEAAA
ncbi:MAG: hypothetical protein RSD57_14640 [Comamonas sp.]